MGVCPIRERVTYLLSLRTLCEEIGNPLNYGWSGANSNEFLDENVKIDSVKSFAKVQVTDSDILARGVQT